MLLVFVLEAFAPFCAARLCIPVVLAGDLRVPAEQEIARVSAWNQTLVPVTFEPSTLNPRFHTAAQNPSTSLQKSWLLAYIAQPHQDRHGPGAAGIAIIQSLRAQR